MPFFSDNSPEANAFETVQHLQLDSDTISDTTLGQAAAYAASMQFEKHTETCGEPDNLNQAKDITTGISGAFIDMMVETRGLDFIDREKARYYAGGVLEPVLAEKYSN